MTKTEIKIQNLTWIDLISPKKESLDQLASALNIPNRILINALDPEHLPKYEPIESATVIYLRVVDQSKSKAVNLLDLTTKITLIITDKFFVTIHRLDHSFLKELRSQAIEKEFNLKELIKRIIISSMFTYDQPIIELEARMEKFEENILMSSKNQDIITEGYFLKRKATTIRKILKFSNDILIGLQNRPEFIWRDFQGLRESIDRNLFYTEDLLENINGLLNLYISLSAQKTNEVMRVLTVFSIFFLPLNFLAGVYGMNFDYMPELHHPVGYFYVLGLMFIISLVIFYWVYKRGWLQNPNKKMT